MSVWMSHFSSVFERRFRGVRLIEIIGLALALMMIVWICLSKVREGEDVKRLNELNAEISAQAQTVNELKIAVSHLERPDRLEALAKGLQMKPVEQDHEANMDTLGEISRTGSSAEAPAHTAQAPAAASKLDLAIETVTSPPQSQANRDAVAKAIANRPLEIDVAPAPTRTSKAKSTGGQG